MINTPAIKHRIISVEHIREISLSDTCTSEIRVTFKCCSPVNDMDTFSTINRYFDDGIDFKYDTVISDNGFILWGSLLMCNPDSIKNITPVEFNISLSAVLAMLLENGAYAQQCDLESIMAEAWFGEPCEMVKVTWISS